MLILIIGLSILGAFLCSGSGLFIPAVINAVLCGWSNGVNANFVRDPMNAPNWSVTVGWLTGLLSIGFIIAGLIF